MEWLLILETRRKSTLTEAEIKEDFAWLWQFAEDVKEDE